MIAIQKFHHKNKKQAFLMPYWAATGLNVAGPGLGVGMVGRSMPKQSAVVWVVMPALCSFAVLQFQLSVPYSTVEPQALWH